MDLVIVALLVTLGLFAGMLACSEIGRRVGLARIARHADGLSKGAGPAEAALFGLLGLLVAFTFSSAAGRFEERKQLLTIEANAIGTAYLRLDLLSADAQAQLKPLLRRYVDARAATYRDVADQAGTNARLAEGLAMQAEIWSLAVAASRGPETPPQAAIVLLPALNEMFDVTTTRSVASRNHPPLVVFLLLAGLSLVGALLVGYDTSLNAKRSWFHTVVFASILSLTVNVIVDLEFPRLGLIRVDAYDQVLFDLRASMK